ncbi:MAG: caspase family protein, partial [Planctomycetota bacterium]|nr:caspase family protein [Planctomycetota bacterium]
MSGKILLLAAIFAAAAASASAAGDRAARNGGGTRGETRALLIGLNYDNAPDMADYRLRYSVNDVRGVKEMLIRYCGVEAGNIETLTDADRPDARAIRRKIAELAARAGPSDRVILFYSGHGVTHDGRWAMVPYDFQQGGIDTGLVWNRELTRTLEESRAAEKLFICDSCFSGSEKSLPPALLVPNPEFGSKAPGADSAKPTLRLELGGWGDLLGGGPGDGSKAIGDGIVRLCSSGADQKSREFAPAEMGVFTSSMVGAVRDWWGRTDRGELTLGGVFRGIYRDVTRKGNHSPFLTENGRGVVLAAKGTGTAAQAPVRPSPRPETGYPGRVRGLMVGLRYRGDPAGTNQLRFTENDVNAVREAMLRAGGAEEADIKVLTDADRPTREVILRELRNLAESAAPDDRIFFFFSGHGARNGEYANIVPHGYEGWEDGVAFSADIKPILESSAAVSKWMFIDACHSGLKGVKAGLGLDGTDMMVGELEAYRRRPGAAKAPFDIGQRVEELIRFTSSYGEETSLESSSIGMGYFSYYLAQALTDPEADNDGDGLYTGDNLVDYMTPRMIESTGGHHRPRMSENGLNIVLASAGPPSGPPPAPDGPSDRDMPPLCRAVLAGDYLAAKQLLDSGDASVDDADATGWTALHFASTAALAELLMANGADANRQSNLGFTPLHTAAMLGRLEVVVALLHSGPNRREARADAGIVDKWGKTARHRALEKGNQRIADVIEPPE